MSKKKINKNTKKYLKKSRKNKKNRITRKKQLGCNQKIWNMNGCAHHKYSESKCPLCRKQMQNGGGMCSTCGIQNGGRGGFYHPAAPIPGPFIGSAWNGNVIDWPGVDGISSGRNYLAKNLYHSDPQTMMHLGGKKQNKNQRGGIIPQDLVNLGRDFSYNIGSAYNALNGYSKPVNPSPYMDQFAKSKALII